MGGGRAPPLLCRIDGSNERAARDPAQPSLIITQKNFLSELLGH
jgi:hypothetical protein